MDTDGRTRTLRIEIDNQPPAIQITSPVHNTASDDHSPDFNGSFEDTDSGLVAESFRLVVDNDSDGEKNDDYVVNGPEATDVTGPDEGVTHGGDLTGYSDTNAVLGSRRPMAPMAFTTSAMTIVVITRSATSLRMITTTVPPPPRSPTRCASTCRTAIKMTP